MNKDEILRIAADCGIPEFENNESQADNILRFAALVAAAEREECAQFLEHGVDLAGMSGSPGLQRFCATMLQGCADGLRKAGQQ
jgi:hypothetical protein